MRSFGMSERDQYLHWPSSAAERICKNREKLSLLLTIYYLVSVHILQDTQSREAFPTN